MARFLTDNDYLKVSLSESVRELIEENYNEWLNAEQVAMKEMISYIKQRYDTDTVFVGTTVFNYSYTYKAKRLVSYTEDEYNELTAYSVGDRVSYDGYIYQCIQAAQGIKISNEAYWVQRVKDGTLYHGTTPEADWDKDTSYEVGDVVFYKDKTYTAVQSNKNILPTSSTAIWGSGTAYTIAADQTPDIEYHEEITYALNDKVTFEGLTYKAKGATVGNLPTNATYWEEQADYYVWTLGDNRNELLVRFLLDMANYHFMRAIPGNAIPIHVKEAYNGNSPSEVGGAIGWLKNVGKGTVSCDLPEKYASPLYSIMHGSTADKRDNQLF